MSLYLFFSYFCKLKKSEGNTTMAKIKRSTERKLDPEMAEALRVRMLQLKALNAIYGGGHEFCPADSVEQHFIPDL